MHFGCLVPCITSLCDIVAHSFAYATVTAEAVTLYIHPGKVTDDVRAHLGDAVVLRPYDAVLDDVIAYATSGSGKVMLPAVSNVRERTALVMWHPEHALQSTMWRLASS